MVKDLQSIRVENQMPFERFKGVAPSRPECPKTDVGWVIASLGLIKICFLFLCESNVATTNQISEKKTKKKHYFFRLFLHTVFLFNQHTQGI